MCCTVKSQGRHWRDSPGTFRDHQHNSIDLLLVRSFYNGKRDYQECEYINTEL